jgi:hypothetical protein
MHHVSSMIAVAQDTALEEQRPGPLVSRSSGLEPPRAARVGVATARAL